MSHSDTAYHRPVDIDARQTSRLNVPMFLAFACVALAPFAALAIGYGLGLL